MVREEVLLEEYHEEDLDTRMESPVGRACTALYNLTMVGEALETELGIRFLGSSLRDLNPPKE